LEAAASHFSRVTNLSYRVHAWAYREASVGLALTYQAQGQSDKATQAVEQLLTFGLAKNYPKILETIDTLRMHLALLRDDEASARRWARKMTLAPEQESAFDLESPGRNQVKWLLAQRTATSLHEAAHLLETLHQHAEAVHDTRHQIEILALQALVCDAQGEREAALDTLTGAVTLAQPGGLIRTFVNLGPALAKLLVRLARRRGGPDYIDQVLAAFGNVSLELNEAELSHNQVKIVSPTSEVPTRLIEPLTNRELEVLRLLYERLSNKEIAQDLVISPRTVKKHTTNIYRKLGVHKRREAVIKATQIGLLSNEY
jgi:LuxR family maltose regulon positive regulatory protein